MKINVSNPKTTIGAIVTLAIIVIQAAAHWAETGSLPDFTPYLPIIPLIYSALQSRDGKI
jgi:hypothetical protein